MKSDKIINYKIDLLIDLMLTDGVSPQDLTDNIFSEQYNKIIFYKKDGFIIGEITFLSENGKPITMIYTYTIDRKVLRISERTKYKEIVLWDRKMREQEIITELLDYMSMIYTEKQIKRVIEKLPDELKYKVLSLSA